MKNKLLNIILSVACGLSIVCSVVSLSVGLSHINNTTINEKVEVIESTLDDLDALDTTLDGKIKDLEKDVSTLESELEETNTAIDVLDSDVKSLQEAKETLEADITSIKVDIESLKAKDTDLEGKITTLETTLNSSIDDVKKWVEDNYATIESCEELEDEIRGLINSLDSRVTALETSVDTLNEAVEALEEQAKQNKEKIDELEIRINCLEGNHVPNPENVMYSWNDDYSECSAIGHCIYCEEAVALETVEASEESTGHYIATFENEAFGTQHMVLNGTALKSITSGTITLGNNIDLTNAWELNGWKINEGTDITLNLNGKTLNYVGSGYAIFVKGKITIEDSIGTGLITSSKDYGIINNDGGTVVINSGNIVLENSVAISNTNNGTTIINGGNIKGNINNTDGITSGLTIINGGFISSTITYRVTINGSPILTTGWVHFSVYGDNNLIDLRNYTGTETFSIRIMEASTSQIALPEGWSLYEDIDETIPAADYYGSLAPQVIYAIKNESLN